MNYETDIAPRLSDGKDAIAIAEEINAERKANANNYVIVKSHQVAFWLATNGLLSRVDKWMAANTDHQYYDTLSSAWEGVKAMRSNVNAFMQVGPGQSHRQLIDLAIAVGAMTIADRNEIDAIAYRGTSETAESVQGVIDAWNAPANQWQRAVAAGAAVIEAGGTVAEAIAAMGVA